MTRRWQIGDVFVLRHAGFPFDWLEHLGVAEGLDALAQDVLEAEAAWVGRVRAEKGDTRARAVAEDLRHGRVPQGSSAQKADAARWKTAWDRFVSAYEDERRRLREALRQRARDERIKEAVFLSSPAMFDNVWRRYVEAEQWPDNADARRVDRQAYTYLQRFCGKNETTSFFGPIAYGHVVDEDGFALRVRPSQRRGRRTFFSFWAVSELARAVNRDAAFRFLVPLRWNPIFKREGDKARCPPLGLEVTLSSTVLAMLDGWVDGQNLTELAQRVGGSPQELERALIPLFRTAAVLRGLSFDQQSFDTFEHLLGQLQALPDVPARDAWLTRLRAIDAVRDRFQSAPLEQRRQLLPQLEALFTELTGKPARRGEGQIYSDRLILYEEAASPFAVEFGRRFGAAVGEAISGALELSAAYGERVQERFGQEVAQKLGTDLAQGELDFLTYVTRLRPEEVAGSRFSPIPPVLLEAPAEGDLQLPRDRLGTSRAGGRYALPDVCLSGPAADGTAPAEAYEVLVSRVHHHLLLWSWLSAFHPDRSKYEGSARRWIEAEPSARGLVGLSVRRRNKGFYVYPGRRLVYSASDAGDLDASAHGPYEVSVRFEDGQPRLVGPNGEPLHLYLPLDDFSSYPPFAALAHPQVLHAPLRPTADRLPRVRIEGALYQRARWEVPTAAVSEGTGASLFLEVFRQRREHGWPRFVFVRTDVERKPYLIDTRSPFALELLRHVAKSAEKMTVVEMYPPPEGLWLQDEAGHRYTCEMRMQAERWSEAPSAANEDRQP